MSTSWDLQLIIHPRHVLTGTQTAPSSLGKRTVVGCSSSAWWHLLSWSWVVFCFFALQLGKKIRFPVDLLFSRYFHFRLCMSSGELFWHFHISLELWTLFVNRHINSIVVPQGLRYPFKQKECSIPVEIQEFACMINSWHISAWNKLSDKAGFVCPHLSQSKIC